MGHVQYLRSRGFDPSVPMSDKISEWFQWYTATHPWYSSLESSADGRSYKVERLTLKPARMVCQEWASLMLNERTVVSCDDELSNEVLDVRFSEARFFSSGQGLVERAFALGTGAWVLRLEDVDEGQAYSPGVRARIQRFDARHIKPLTYDEDGCTECAFISHTVIGGKKLEQIQLHLLEGGRYVIETVLLDEHGDRVDVPGILPRFDTQIATPLFSLVRPALENTHWDWGPFGVSVFDDAIGAVKLVDSAADNTFKDLWLGQKMLFLDERMLQTGKDGRIIVPRAKDQQLFRKAEMDNGKSSLIEEYNPDLRVADNKLALTTALCMLGARCGMGPDYFSLGEGDGIKTATEVVAEQSDLFRNVRKHENLLAESIKAVARAALAVERDIRGASLPEDVGEIRVSFDDSVIEDTAALRKRDIEDVASGLMQPWEYRAKWYGEDEETARVMVGLGDGLPPEE